MAAIFDWRLGCLLLLWICTLTALEAQDDLGRFLIENRSLIQELINSGQLTEDKIEELGRSSGLNSSQLDQLKQLVGTENTDYDTEATSSSQSLKDKNKWPKLYRRLLRDSTLEQTKSIPIYGMSLFEGLEISFTPSLQIPTPRDYILGAGDEVVIDIWGASEKHYNLPIDKQGQISVPKLGLIRVGGLKFEAAERRIRSRLQRIYAGLSEERPGGANTFMQLSLGALRTINVHVVGEVVQPGTYSLPAFATLFHALYYAGGANRQGSIRKVELSETAAS